MVPLKQEDLFPSNFLDQPCLVQCHGASKATQTFINLTDNNIEEKEIAEMQGKLCFGSSIDEWLFVCDEESTECFFLDPNSRSKVHLPPLLESPRCLYNFSVSSSLDDPDCAIIFTGKNEYSQFKYFLLYCRPLDKRWTKLPLNLPGYSPPTTTVIYDGKLYALIRCADAIAVFDVPSLFGDQVDATIIWAPDKSWSIYPKCDSTISRLVESRGVIYLVRIKGYRNDPVTYMDIHRLDISSKLWLRVDSIGDLAFFLLDHCAASVRATDVGAQRNCIYYVPRRHNIEQRIYRFSLDDHTMTFSSISLEEGTEYTSRLCLFVPTRSQSMIRNSSIQTTLALNEPIEDGALDDGIMKDVFRAWDELPIDLLELLLPYLSLVDSIRLPTVCKAWNLISNPFAKARTWPWLMYHTKADGTCKLLDPINGKEYTTKIPETLYRGHIQILSSKEGWIVVLDEEYDDFSFFILNPFFPEVVELPCFGGIESDLLGIIFTSVPTSQDCIVFGITTDMLNCPTEIYQLHHGEKKWRKTRFPVGIDFSLAHTNPVFFHGELYCLGKSGKLGVFNPADKTWRVLDKPEPIYPEDEEALFLNTKNCYLLVLGEELVSVFKNKYGDYNIRVFKLDQSKMEWITIDDLADWILFLDRRNSFAKPSPNKRWSNKILFSAFHSGTSTCETYCMKSKTFNMNFSDMNEPLDCVWLEPNLT